MTTKNHFPQRVLTDKEHKNLLILDIVRKNGPISRTDISKITGFNIVTTSNYINHYLETGLAVEKELDASTGGRKPVLVSLDRKAAFAAGISVEKGLIRGLVTDLECRSIHEKQEGFDAVSPEAAEEKMIKFAQDLCGEAKVDPGKVRGLGVALPGIVDPHDHWFPRRGSAVFKKSAENIHLTIGKHFPFPVYLESDLNAAVLAERWLGLSSEIQHVLYLGSSGGCGIVIDGEIYRGTTGSAGEIEDHLADLSGDLGLPERAFSEIRKGRQSSLAKLVKEAGHTITLEVLARAVKEGDALAKEIITEGAKGLGQKVTALVKLFNPEVVVIGGGMEKGGTLVFDILKTCLKEEVFKEAAVTAKVIPSAFGEKAPLWGAAGIVLREIFKSA